MAITRTTVARFARRESVWSAAFLVLASGQLAFVPEPPATPEVLEVPGGHDDVPIAPPGTAVLAPTRGAPLIAPPGARIAVDVIVRLPLTPPPGIQQERALVGWAATAIGYSDLGPRPSYALLVTSVRPLGSARAYRVLLELPPWMAEGVYDLLVEGRAFSERQQCCLVVLPERHQLPVCTLASEPLATQAKAAALQGALVCMLPGGIARAAEGVARAHETFLADFGTIAVATAVRPSAVDRAAGRLSYRRLIGPLEYRSGPIGTGSAIDRARTRAISAASVSLGTDGLVNNGQTPAHVYLRVTSRSASELRVAGRTPRPTAVNLTGGVDAPGALRVYSVVVEPGARLPVELASLDNPQPHRPKLVAPRLARVAEPVGLQAATATGSAIGWSFGDETLGFGAKVSHRFSRIGRHRVQLAVAVPNGAVARAHAEVEVQMPVQQGCAAGGSRPTGNLLPAALVWLIGVARNFLRSRVVRSLYVR